MSEQTLHCWKARTKALENYRLQLKNNLSGTNRQYQAKEIKEKVKVLLNYVNTGIEEAMQEEKVYGKGICPTYFYYTVTEYTKTEDGIEILDAKQEKVPYFLEGSVRYLKRNVQFEERQRLYKAIRNSHLFDEKLRMYKVNAGLADATYELGRARAFTPGWLENESIWLHMEYKYLLEILKSGLEDEFLKDFRLMAIPFQKEERYGRSILENSSFLASSANPDKTIHGKGFVARLSGSTVEFIHMWQIMMFGNKPFTLKELRKQKPDKAINISNTGSTPAEEYTSKNKILSLQFKPLIPAYLIGEDKKISAKFMGTTKVTYYLPDQNEITCTNSNITAYEIIFPDQSTTKIQAQIIQGELAESIRRGEAREIRVYLSR